MYTEATHSTSIPVTTKLLLRKVLKTPFRAAKSISPRTMFHTPMVFSCAMPMDTRFLLDQRSLLGVLLVVALT